MVLYTFPSAQLIISLRGRFARYMLVVFHHIGKPRNMTIAQKDRMTSDRLWISAGFSGGGCFGLVMLTVGSGSAMFVVVVVVVVKVSSSLLLLLVLSPFSGMLLDMAI